MIILCLLLLRLSSACLITSWVGRTNSTTSQDGSFSTAQFKKIEKMALNGTMVFVGQIDGNIRMINPIALDVKSVFDFSKNSLPDTIKGLIMNVNSSGFNYVLSSGFLYKFNNSGNIMLTYSNFSNFNDPKDMLLDSSDSLMIADHSQNRVVLVDEEFKYFSIVIDGFSDQLDGICQTPGSNDLFVLTGSTICLVDLAKKNISIVVGVNSKKDFKDGPGNIARINSPTSCFIWGNYLYFSDTGNNRIRRMNITSPYNVETYAGGGNSSRENSSCMSFSFSSSGPLALLPWNDSLLLSDNCKIYQISDPAIWSQPIPEPIPGLPVSQPIPEPIPGLPVSQPIPEPIPGLPVSPEPPDLRNTEFIFNKFQMLSGNYINVQATNSSLIIQGIVKAIDLTVYQSSIIIPNGAVIEANKLYLSSSNVSIEVGSSPPIVVDSCPLLLNCNLIINITGNMASLPGSVPVITWGNQMESCNVTSFFKIIGSLVDPCFHVHIEQTMIGNTLYIIPNLVAVCSLPSDWRLAVIICCSLIGVVLVLSTTTGLYYLYWKQKKTQQILRKVLSK